MAGSPRNDVASWLARRLQHRLGAEAPIAPPESVDAVLQHALQTARNDLFLQAAALPEANEFGVSAYALISAPEPAHAVEALLAHPLFDNPLLRTQLIASDALAPSSETEEQLTVRLEPAKRLAPRHGLALCLEAFSSMIGLLRWRQNLLGTSTPRLESLVLDSRLLDHGPGPGLPQPDDYQRLLGLLPGASGRRNEVSVALGTADHAPATAAQASLPALLGATTRTLYENARHREDLAAQLTRIFVEGFGRIGRADKAAAALRTSERTMRRRLSGEGTSFQKLLDGYREALAKDYLQDTSLSTQRIGELLGFTEATNFRRAFLRWSGHSPHNFRAAVRAARPAA